jgi:hypothetical protein
MIGGGEGGKGGGVVDGGSGEITRSLRPMLCETHQCAEPVRRTWLQKFVHLYITNSLKQCSRL